MTFALRAVLCFFSGVAVARFLYWAGFTIREFQFWMFASVLDLIASELVNVLFK